MPCECVQTAVLMQYENEKLKNQITQLERKVKKYQEELYMLYSSGDSHNSDESKQYRRKHHTSSKYRMYVEKH